MPCLSVRGVSRLSVGALPGHFICQTMDGLVVGQDGADVLLKQSREPQTHAVDPGLLTGRVSFGVAENEPDVFAELNGRLVLSFFERFEDGAEVYWRVNDLKVVGVFL